jgi:hypothetical protein
MRQTIGAFLKTPEQLPEFHKALSQMWNSEPQLTTEQLAAITVQADTRPPMPGQLQTVSYLFSQLCRPADPIICL